MDNKEALESADAQTPAISISDLSKSYGATLALDRLSLEVHRGEIFGFLGLNGAGKTTTIRLLLDLIRPTRGEARIHGLQCRTNGEKVRSLVGYLPGELGLYPEMTGDELLRLLGDLGERPVDGAYRDRLLERLRLSKSDLKRKLREYSTGMKRKVGLVQALQSDPPLLILDEPTEGLDPLMQRELNQLLSELRERGRTVFMSSHVLSEVERVCDRIAVIRAGRLVLLSTVEEARRRGGRDVHVSFSREVEPHELPPGLSYVDTEPARWHLRLEGEAGGLMKLLGVLPVLDVEIVEPALEDVLRSFYDEEPS